MLLCHMRQTIQSFTVLLLAIFTLNTSAFAQEQGAAAAPAPTTNLYIGLLGGVSIAPSVPGSNTSTATQFNYGARVGIDLFKVTNFSTLALGVSYDDYAISNVLVGGSRENLGYASVLLQANFRKVAGTGFYFGPEAGFAIMSVDTAITGVATVGGFAGYEFKIGENFAVGPEAHYDHFGPGTLNSQEIFATHAFKFLAAATYFFH